MLSDMIRWFGGVIEIQICGAEPERFFNLCKKHHIMLRHIRRTDLDRVQAMLTLRDFWRLSRVYRRTRCRVHILKKRGMPFVWKRLRHRYGLGVGVLLMCFVCFELLTRIWVIQTDFSQETDSAAIWRVLQEQGVGIGTKQSDIVPSQLKVIVMNELQDLKYFAVNIDGNILSIQAKTRIPIPEMDKEQGVHNIVAARDGVIERQIVRRGTQKYQIGDAVLAGSVLVDALVETEAELGTSELVDANADIWAATRYHITRKMPLRTQKKQYTGKQTAKYAICFGKTRINLYFGSSLTAIKCDRIIMVDTVKLNEHFALPITLLKETIRPYETKAVTHKTADYIQRMQYGVKRAAEQMLQEGNVTSVQTDFSTEEDAAAVHAVVWCYEQIGMRVEDTRTQADLPDKTSEQDQ